MSKSSAKILSLGAIILVVIGDIYLSLMVPEYSPEGVAVFAVGFALPIVVVLAGVGLKAYAGAIIAAFAVSSFVDSGFHFAIAWTTAIVGIAAGQLTSAEIDDYYACRGE